MDDPETQLVPNAPSPTLLARIEGGISAQVADYWQGGTELETGVASAVVNLAAGEASTLSDFFGALSATLKESPHAVGYVVGAASLWYGYSLYKKWRRSMRAK